MTPEATASTGEAYVFNPFVEGFAENPYPHYAELRERAPAHEHPLGFWILSRYDTLLRLHRSAHSVDERLLIHVPLSKDDPKTVGIENRPGGGLSMLDRDPPDHTRMRRLVSKAFTRRAVDAFEPRITALVDDALDRVAEAGEADLVAELAFPLPFVVISELLGVPVAEQDRVRELSGILALTTEPLPDPEKRAQVRAANQELMGMAREMIGWKRANPSDDVLSAMITAEDDGDMLTEDELVSQLIVLYLAGHHTTVNLIAGGILALLRHPDQLRLLQERPELAGAAVDEALRYDSPAHLGRRITVEPFLAHGAEIPVGTFVVSCLAAANRDPAFWGPDADDYRIERPNASQHLSFGSGIHHCIGAALAQLEARVSFLRFSQRFRSPVLENLRWNGRINLRGPAELSVAVR